MNKYISNSLKSGLTAKRSVSVNGLSAMIMAVVMLCITSCNFLDEWISDRGGRYRCG